MIKGVSPELQHGFASSCVAHITIGILELILFSFFAWEFDPGNNLIVIPVEGKSRTRSKREDELLITYYYLIN